jgi:hypothetical protein
VFFETSVDELPNGLAASMIGLLVEWPAGAEETVVSGEDYVVRNVLVGGNPIGGINIMATVRVPRDGVESVQFLVVRDRVGGKENEFGHGQIRFVFKKDRRPEVVSKIPDAPAFNPLLDDLIISWEAWREPGVSYSFAKGLEQGAFSLSVRCYSGMQRFLIDATRGKSWEAFPLALGDSEIGAATVLNTCLVMGDAVSRRVLQDMISESVADAGERGLLDALSPEEEETARKVLAGSNLPSDVLAELTGKGALSYNLLLNSCITNALLAIDVSFARLHDIPVIDSNSRVKIAPESLPDWINDLAHANRREMLAILPSAILWIARNQTVLPARAYMNLEEAGLLQTDEDGKVIRYYYSTETMTPYGPLSRNIM